MVARVQHVSAVCMYVRPAEAQPAAIREPPAPNGLRPSVWYIREDSRKTTEWNSLYSKLGCASDRIVKGSAGKLGGIPLICVAKAFRFRSSATTPASIKTLGFIAGFDVERRREF